MKLSQNFSLQELIKSSTADRNGIDNFPKDETTIERLHLLAVNVLQPVRNTWGPTKINSGFRCFELESTLYQRKVERLYEMGGEAAVAEWFEKKSHPKGEAADIEVPGIDNRDLFNWIRDNLVYDQLFLEFYKEGEPQSGWVHVSFRAEGNRGYSGTIG